MFGQFEPRSFAGNGVNPRQLRIDVSAQGGRELVSERRSRLNDRVHPVEAGVARGRMRKLQEMNEHTLDLAAYGVALALAQILDLLGEVLTIKAIVARAQ